jgi:Terminase small subunit
MRGKSATAAYVAAGYSPRGARGSACQLQANPSIATRIAELKQQAAHGAVMSAQQVLERLTDIVADGGRDQLTIKALELLGKHHDLFTEGRVNVTMNTNFNRLSTAELLAILAEGEGSATGAITDGRDRDGGKP